jgi:hypothetical protein
MNSACVSKTGTNNKSLHRFFAAVLLATPSALVIPAAAAEFQGSLCFVTASPACVAEGWSAGGCFAIRHSVPVMNGRQSTELSMFDRTFSVGITVSGNFPLGATYRNVTAHKVAGGGYSYGMQMRILSRTPAAPTNASQSFVMTGGFSRWDEITGCTMGWRAAGTLQP